MDRNKREEGEETSEGGETVKEKEERGRSNTHPPICFVTDGGLNFSKHI